MSSAPPALVDQVTTGGWLCSRSSSYLVQSFLGRGSFGTVAKCTRMCDMRTVAIKMIKNQGYSDQGAKNEVAALTKLRLLDSDKCNLVRWYQVFSCRGHICLEFEHLDKSLSDFMKERYVRHLLLMEIRPIVQQVATALNHLRSLKMIHADLKLENIMLVNHAQEPYRVKVIDFGLAHEVSSARIGSYIQTRPYRSPEILLGHPFTEAIDMWSLGCMAAEMYLGIRLYPGMSEYDMVRYIVELQGQPSDQILAQGTKTGCFFNRVHKSSNRLYELKTPEQFRWETQIQPMETRALKLKSLYDILNIRLIMTGNSAERAAELVDRLMFVSMLNEMLQLDASKRAAPTEVLEHPFISMRHIVSTYPHSSYAKSCFDIMDVCQNKTPASDSGKAVSGSQQQPSSGTSHTVQQILPPPPSAVWSSLSQPHCSYHHPCTSTQTTGSLKSGMKRKRDPQDGTVNNETSHPSKRVKSGWHRKSHAGSSTSSSSNNIQASTAVRSSLTQPLYLHVNTHPSQSCTGTGIKRKADDEDVECHQSDSDHCKRSDHNRKRFRGSPAGPSATCSSIQTQRNVPPRVKRKRANGEDKDERSDHESKRVRTSHADPPTCSSESTRTLNDQPNQRPVPSEQHRRSTHPSSCAQTESRDRSGLKRKSADEEDVQLRRASDKCGGRRNKKRRVE